MVKATVTGFFAGIVISAILIAATYLRGYIPYTFTGNLFFRVICFVSITSVIWLSLNYCCKTSSIKWMNIGLSGVISGIIAAILVFIFQSPSNTTTYPLSELLIVLLLVIIGIVIVYYIKNRNKRKLPYQHNQELIY